MSDENRETILANFQACTGIEDVAEAFNQLEAADWDLMTAVNRVMAQSGLDVEMVEERINGEMTSVITPVVTTTSNTELPITISSDFVEFPSTSQSKNNHGTRRINFTVTYSDKIVQFDVPESSTIGDVKTLIASKIGVPVCQQIVTGWANEPKSNSDSLKKLNIPRESFLFVTPLDSENNGFSSEPEEPDLNRTYTLNIRDETKKKDYSLAFPGTRTISEVKQDVGALISIPVRHQIWSGWPAGITDDNIKLGKSGIMYPQHPLAVQKSSTDPKKEYKRIVVVDSDSSEECEAFEDAMDNFTVDDEMFVDESASKKLQPLIPNNVEDETAGCVHFADEFRNRYGTFHPEFFPGTLDEAIREACFKPARERRLLAVYLHHEGSVLTNVFCTQLLCFESVVQYLADNFIVWGWDLTYESNKNKFLTSVTNSLGTIAAHTIRNMDVERLPALLIIMRMRSNIEIFTVVHGNVGVNDLLTSLIQAVDLFSEHQRRETREEEERNAREMIKIEQDQAYQQSLEMDRAKEEARKQQELAELLEKERVENERLQTEAKKEAHRLELEKQLPKEPEEGETVGITKIRFRLPKGDSIERNFYASDKLKGLLNYLIVQGYPQEEYKVISSWPRRDLTSLDPEATLQDLKLCPQETLILEER